MARAVMGLATAVVMLMTGTVAYAELSDDDHAAALEAGVDDQDLAAAVATTGAPSARAYLQSVAELPMPTSAVPGPATGPLTGTWRLLANCESSLDPKASGAGGLYRGLFQFDIPSWLAAGGGEYAWRADFASVVDQLTTAQVWQRMNGWRPWPTCARRLGLLV
jgi:hypothetical protein